VDLSRVSFGETVAAAGGLGLFLAMLLPWYGGEETVELPGREVTSPLAESFSAWEAFSLIDLLLFVVVLLAVGMALARAAAAMPRDLPAPPGLIVAAAGTLAVLLVLFRLLDAPGLELEVATGRVSVGRRVGIFLGLIACAAIVYGGYAAVAERSRAAASRGETPPA